MGRDSCGVIITNEQDKFLIVKRAEEEGFGEWSFVGGGIEDEERPIQAVRREVSEEIGSRLLYALYVGEYVKADGGIEYTYYGEAITHCKIVLQESELSEYRWVTLDELYGEDAIYTLYKPSEISLKLFLKFKKEV